MALNSLPKIICAGTPEEIGLAHGRVAGDRIRLGINNYSKLFVELAGITWDNARQRANMFLDSLQCTVPEIMEEMHGIAVGAKVEFLDIVVLNLRSEIALATITDGCTAVAQISNDGDVFVAQNWDWVSEARDTMV